MSERNDLTYVADMLAYSRDAMRFVQGRTREAMDDDLLFVRALIYTTGVIGEAAAKVSHEFREAHLHIPWSQIVGMRNRLFHGYGEINYDRLWVTLETAIPALIAE